ncbi:aminotransferase class IV [Brevibacterium sp.]|uniref:aminotransferase class IV n=1 Tax=Brevibacterium sp. TaxID=1701 RepID=UPI0025BCDF97|nr:aminotransferase class IV [Brevibacterium sp.]
MSEDAEHGGAEHSSEPRRERGEGQMQEQAQEARPDRGGPGGPAFEAPGLWVWNRRSQRFEEERSAADRAEGAEPAGEPSEDGGTGQAPPALLAADSWFVRDGHVRAFDRHAARFTLACEAQGASLVPGAALGLIAQEQETAQGARGGLGPGPVALVEQPDFWDRLARSLLCRGEWFPRIELVSPVREGSVPQLRFRLRPAPPRGEAVSLWVPEVPDPRTHPAVKGPDLDRLAQLRTQAAEWHSQDALLCTPEGVVVEAAHASLLWWEEDALCVPDPRLGVFAGVTVGLLVEEAQRRGIEVRERRVPLTDLLSREVWIANALHGLRRVRAWTGRGADDGVLARPADFVSGDVERQRERRFARWSAWLEAQ